MRRNLQCVAVLMSLTSRSDELWAITSYFNPTGQARRRDNYRQFRERLDVPLIAVELAYGIRPDLSDDDAEILIVRHGADVMWQKERLLNIALEALPETCRKVAWLDCDIVFERDDWAENVCRLLESYKLVQAFERVHQLPRFASQPMLNKALAESTRISAASAIASGLQVADCVGEPVNESGDVYTFSRGYAWAARRELLDEHKFYDMNIVGGGDRAFACAAYGLPEEAARFHRLNDTRNKQYTTWAKSFEMAVGGSIGFGEGDIFHL